jgi:DNA-binding FadR family transcriptional regulator
MKQSQKDLETLRGYVERTAKTDSDRLPPERDLAATLGLTRNRLRGGLRKLAAEGLIWRQVGKGTFVGKKMLAAGAGEHAALARLLNPRDVMEARLSIEPELARLASFRATGNDLTEIDRCVAAMETAREWKSWAVWDRRFHRAIAQGAGNAMMTAMFDLVQAQRNTELYGKLNEAYATKARRNEATIEHAAIAQAIRTRDWRKAESLMRAHLLAVKRQIFGEI